MRAILRWLLLAYLVTLSASHLVRRLPHASTPPPDQLEILRVAARDGVSPRPRTIALAYRQWPGRGSTPRQPPVLLLHGSPGSSSDFRTLGPALAGCCRVMAPDLPGFGYSERQVPDYSIRAHAAYARELLDRLGLDSVHVVGFSMGGGVALELARQAPQRIRSLTLLSAIGVQELELLGNYHLNRAIHGFQFGTLWLLREVVPHFGALDDAFFGVAYARNFLDSDQRPLRAVLERLEPPTLILHGKRDILVPVAAASEHHRLVPQSELVLFDASHFLLFRGGARLAGPIREFIGRVERGAGVRRAAAEPARLSAAALPFDPDVVPRAAGVTLLVLAGLIALATLLTEDAACLATGLLVAQGRIGFVAGTLACFVGIVVGDVLLYWAGRDLGRPWLGRAPLRWFLSPRRVERSSRWFERRGPWVIFLSRFLPGTRVATYFSAGLLHTAFWRFLAYFVLAVAIWTPLLVGAASLLGSRALDLFVIVERWALPSVFVLALAAWLTARLARLLSTWRGRRRIRGWWCRKRHWEFWPPWLFYPPVVLWITWLGLRHRSATLFTAANPAIPAGGFVGESKADILARLAPRWVAPFRRIGSSLPTAAKLSSVREFLSERRLELPVVLKPDAGQRGTGVKIARRWPEIEDYCALARMDFLVQQFVPGVELGVFYFRRPEEARGRILSITRKLQPTVTGDGSATIEELVLADERAVCLAPLYLERLGSRCEAVPAAGEEVVLAELGTHCRGAVFADGSDLLTGELEETVDAMSRTFEGFFFGRYDLRAPCERAFREGRDLVVIELNGVTSEATHIYDRRNSLLDAYRVLFGQWRLAFEIGSQNRARGAAPASLASLCRDLWAYRASRRAARHEDAGA